MGLKNYYAVYDMKENEQCVGVFHGVTEVARYFNLKEQTIRKKLCKNIKVKRRYEIKKVDIDGGE